MRKPLALCAPILILITLLSGLTACGVASESAAKATPADVYPTVQATLAGVIPQPGQATATEQSDVTDTAQPTATPEKTEEVDFFDGIWEQQDADGVIGQYAFLFNGGKIYMGYKGDSPDEILSDTNNLGGLRGFPYSLESNKIVIIAPDGSVMEWKHSVDSFWIAGNMPDIVPAAAAGEYLPGGE